MIIDVNVSLGSWPFKELAIDSPEKPASHFKKLDISQAWVRSCRAAFLTNPANDNEKLCNQLAPYQNLIAVPTINPILSQWEQSLSLDNTKIINLYPSYHRYKADSPEVCRLAALLAEKQGTLLITMRMEDSRSMHPDCIIPGIPTEEIIALAAKYPELKIVCLNATIFEMEKLLTQSPNIYCDMAYTEMGDTIKNLIEKVNYTQIVFGSHTPFYTTGAQLMKIKHSEVSGKVKKAILYSNIS